jgi:hypothetical protein
VVLWKHRVSRCGIPSADDVFDCRPERVPVMVREGVHALHPPSTSCSSPRTHALTLQHCPAPHYHSLLRVCVLCIVGAASASPPSPPPCHLCPAFGCVYPRPGSRTTAALLPSPPCPLGLLIACPVAVAGV